MSESRRKVLAAGAAAIPEAALDAAGLTALAPEGDEICARPPRVRGPHADYFPNLVLVTHEGQRALFYDDLLMGGKSVLINCMSIAGDADYPVTANLAQVQPYFGESLGRDVFMYSLSVDPEDTPEALEAFAHRHGARDGWTFLTGAPDDVELLRGRLFSHNAGVPHGTDCSVGLCRYGNESIGLWGACPARANPEWIAKRLSWVRPRPATAGPHKRRGPHPHTWRT